MSWFGETFGDSLNSLKGQITKITKEVLAEEDNENEEADSVKLKYKELEALCSSKDLEIFSLREENLKVSQRFQEELKYLRKENIKLKTDLNKGKDDNIVFSEDQIRQVCELENQLQQLKIERDHLEEIQKDHQSNICLVVQQRDKYKQELEKIKGDYSALQLKYDEFVNNKDNTTETNCLSDINLVENQAKYDESILLRDTVDKLQIQVETYENEKEGFLKAIQGHELNYENLNEEIKKLIEKIQILENDKKTVELENEKLRARIECITSDLNGKVDELKLEQKGKSELEKNLKELTETLNVGDAEQTDIKTNFQHQVKKLTNIFFTNDVDKYSDISLSALISEIESFWINNVAEKESMEKMYAEKLSKLESDIEWLQSDKSKLENEVTIEIDKRNELECNYKKEINSLQSKYLKLKSEEQDCIIKSQTDDVKRLNQEVSKLMEAVELKNNELSDCYNKINAITQELNTLKILSSNTEHELLKLASEKEAFENTMGQWKSDLESKENQIKVILNDEKIYKERCKVLEDENKLLLQKNNAMQDQLNEIVNKNKDLENNIDSLKKMMDRFPSLEKELQDTVESKSELEKICAELQQVKLNYENQFENLKAQLIIKESNISELNVKIKELTQELSQSRESISKLQGVEEELNKWKEAMVELEMQRQELSEQKESLQNKCANLESQILNIQQKDEEIDRIRRENVNLTEACNRLQNEVESKIQNDVDKVEDENGSENNGEVIFSLKTEIDNLKSNGQEQANIITSLTRENNELVNYLRLANENIAALNEVINQLKNEDRTSNSETKNAADVQGSKNAVRQHRRSKSDFDTADDVDINALRLELEKVKEISQRQLQDYKTLQEQHNMITEKEAHSKKELERLRLHLIEIENYYTETIDEYKTKLNATEEQLKSSSSFYTSNKVRDNQHLESLQNQIRLISAQRDALQQQLSTAEDEVQKHKAALTSFHVVLEQFQQDKERECESIAVKYQNQLLSADKRFTELQQEIESLNNQLSDAKNGLKAASRLGEQLEKKNEHIADLEAKLSKMEVETKELEESAKLVNQSNFDKVDKSLLKNLLLGYVSSQKADRKEQVLRIMMSVLDFDEEERNRIGIDNTQSGWLPNLLHPRGDSGSSSQSLSEAFIRFLENESRPKPQLKLLPERTSHTDKPRSATSTPKPSLLLQELVLPTFNSPQTSESTILKDVLNDS